MPFCVVTLYVSKSWECWSRCWNIHVVPCPVTNLNILICKSSVRTKRDKCCFQNTSKRQDWEPVFIKLYFWMDLMTILISHQAVPPHFTTKLRPYLHPLVTGLIKTKKFSFSECCEDTLSVTACEEVVSWLNKHDVVIEWKFMKIAPPWNEELVASLIDGVIPNPFDIAAKWQNSLTGEMLRYRCYTNSLSTYDVATLCI